MNYTDELIDEFLKEEANTEGISEEALAAEFNSLLDTNLIKEYEKTTGKTFPQFKVKFKENNSSEAVVSLEDVAGGWLVTIDKRKQNDFFTAEKANKFFEYCIEDIQINKAKEAFKKLFSQEDLNLLVDGARFYYTFNNETYVVSYGTIHREHQFFSFVRERLYGPEIENLTKKTYVQVEDFPIHGQLFAIKTSWSSDSGAHYTFSNSYSSKTFYYDPKFEQEIKDFTGLASLEPTQNLPDGWGHIDIFENNNLLPQHPELTRSITIKRTSYATD